MALMLYHSPFLTGGSETIVSDDASFFAVPPSEGDGAVSANVALRILSKMLVPFPSLARTDPEENDTVAGPIFFTRKVMLKIFPLAPWNPGFTTTPPKLTVPSLLENDGSCTQRFTTEFVFEMESTSNWFDGNESVPCAAFIAAFGVETYSPSVKV